MKSLRTAWSRSKFFRTVLIVALVWFILRLSFQFIYAAGLFPELTGAGDLPADLPVYMGAAQHFQAHQAIYPQDLSDSTNQYPYSPPFAMLSIVLLWLPARWVAILATLFSVVAAVLIYTGWMAIFKKLKLERVRQQMAWTLPVWLIFSAFWGDIVYLNIGIIVALAATWLIRCVLEERLGWAVLLATFLLISKIMWAFPLAVPLLVGKRKFFFKLLGLAILGVLAMAGITFLVGGTAYISGQYGAYFDQLRRLTTDFPWHTWSNTHILGYNNSIKQMLIFVLGDQTWVQLLAILLKTLILLPLAGVCLNLLLHPIKPEDTVQSSRRTLDLLFALYLGTFIWLDIVWEVLLGIVIFAYLLATLEKNWQKVLVWGIFLVYALVDVIQLLSYAIAGDAVIEMNGEYVLTDPSIYIPLTMMVILLFYIFVVRRLWLGSFPKQNGKNELKKNVSILNEKQPKQHASDNKAGNERMEILTHAW